jgi:hypothetical protein
MSARRADQAPRRIGLQPSFILAAIPDAIFRPEHPPAPFAVEHGEVSDRKPEGARRQAAFAPLIDKMPVTDLSLGERIDGHAESIARSESEAHVSRV